MAVAFSSAAQAQTTIHANPGTLGWIPDGAGLCGGVGAPLDVTFSVGAIPPVSTVSLSLAVTHNYVGDLLITLIAPGGAQHVIAARTGATSDDPFNGSAFGGASANLDGTYTFADGAPGNWWTTAGALGPTDTVPPGAYRTSQPGGPGSTGAVTSMNSAFAGVSSTGTWILRFADRCLTDVGNVTAASLTLGGVPPTVTSLQDTYSVSFATPRSVSAPGVLANDSTTSGTLTAALVSGPSHGTVTLNSDGSFDYAPPGTFFGDDTFTYRASAYGTQSAPTTVTLSVSPPPITAVADTYETAFGSALHVAAPGVVGNDFSPYSPVTAVLDSLPAHGIVALADDGSFVYTPSAGYIGSTRLPTVRV